MPNVEQKEDEGEIIRQRLRNFQPVNYGEDARELVDIVHAWDRYRVKVRARATSGSKRPGLLGQQQEAEDYLLLDIEDEYEAVHSATIFLCNLHPRATEADLRTLFVQAGPIVDVYLPKDSATKRHHGCGFVEFQNRYSVGKAILDLNWSPLFGKPIDVVKAIQVKKNSLDAGANLFVTYLNPTLDENKIYAILKESGVSVRHIKMMKDPDSGGSLGSGFFQFDSFEALYNAMSAIMSLNRKYPCGCSAKIFYACMKGVRHDTPTDRMLASNSNPNTRKSRSHPKIASGPPLGAAHHLLPPPQWQQMGQGMLSQHLQQFCPPPARMSKPQPPPPPPPQMMNRPPKETLRCAVPPQLLRLGRPLWPLPPPPKAQ